MGLPDFVGQNNLGNLLFPIEEERQAKNENEIASHISTYCFVLESYFTALASQSLSLEVAA